jgi:hypothetical protein
MCGRSDKKIKEEKKRVSKGERKIMMQKSDDSKSDGKP